MRIVSVLFMASLVLPGGRVEAQAEQAKPRYMFAQIHITGFREPPDRSGKHVSAVVITDIIELPANFNFEKERMHNIKVWLTPDGGVQPNLRSMYADIVLKAAEKGLEYKHLVTDIKEYTSVSPDLYPTSYGGDECDDTDLECIKKLHQKLSDKGVRDHERFSDSNQYQFAFAKGVWYGSAILRKDAAAKVGAKSAKPNAPSSGASTQVAAVVLTKTVDGKASLKSEPGRPAPRQESGTAPQASAKQQIYTYNRTITYRSSGLAPYEGRARDELEGIRVKDEPKMFFGALTHEPTAQSDVVCKFTTNHTGIGKVVPPEFWKCEVSITYMVTTHRNPAPSRSTGRATAK